MKDIFNNKETDKKKGGKKLPKKSVPMQFFGNFLSTLLNLSSPPNNMNHWYYVYVLQSEKDKKLYIGFTYKKLREELSIFVK